MGSNSTFLFGHQSYMLGAPYIGCMDPSVAMQWSPMMGVLIDEPGTQPGWLPVPALCRGYQTTVGQSCV